MDRQTEEIDRVREIVNRTPAPDFVAGFDVEFGTFDGDPAMWVVFKRIGDAELTHEELRARARRMNEYTAAVGGNLLSEFEDRYPYFRSVDAQETAPQE